MNPLIKEESPQPVGGVGRAPEEQNHRRDDQAVVRASENVTVSSPTRQKPGQEKRLPELVGSSGWNSAQTSREHEDNQRRGQRDCDSVKQPSSVQDPGVRAQTNRNDIITVCDVTEREGLDGRDRQACLRRCQQASH